MDTRTRAAAVVVVDGVVVCLALTTGGVEDGAVRMPLAMGMPARVTDMSPITDRMSQGAGGGVWGW